MRNEGMPSSESTIRPSAVLVVDDEEGTRLVMARMLQGQGIPVITASSGAEAVALLTADNRSIGTVLTDVTMPDMTGVELAYQVRERHPHIGIVIVSGDISDIERSVVARAGVPFLKKPVRIDALLGAIRDASRPPGHEHGHEASAATF
jgi:two-component system, cell cycle sensor histidine kinase and response regulator CckA